MFVLTLVRTLEMEALFVLIALEFAETCDLLACIKPLFTVAVLSVMLILLELALICDASEVKLDVTLVA